MPADKSQTTGSRDYFGYLRWTPTSCRRCGYERADCTCPVGFAAPTKDEPMTDKTTKDPAWYKNHDLAVMRQALAKLEEAAALIESAECSLGDMPPLRSPIYGQHMDQTVGEVLAKVIIVSDALKVAINAR